MSDRTDSLPTAVMKRTSRVSGRWIVWLIPLAAIAFAAWLAFSAWRQRGIIISMQFENGHGLEVGDEVRYRGVAVGEVRDIELDEHLGHLSVELALATEGRRIARAGSRFWIVRPKLNLTGIEGMETLIGPRYIAVLPGPTGGRPQREFIGLEAPPIIDRSEPGDLEVILEASRRGSVRPGAPVTYRQVRIGTVLSVGLSSDGSAVESRLHIAKPYRALIRSRTRFWDAGGLEADLGISGLSVEMDSLQQLIAGGVALATPPAEEMGEVVNTGHRFQLHEKADAEWLKWKPTVAVGSTLLPRGSALPHPLRATIGWRQGRIFRSARTHQGWVLQTEEGLLGPLDLLRPGQKADEATIELEVAGQVLPLRKELETRGQGLGLLPVQVSEVVWPAELMRRAAEPEDCIAVADPAASPQPLSAARLRSDSGQWVIDGAVPLDESWHGAAVVSRQDGMLIGFILMNEDDEAVVTLLPE